MPPTTFRGIEHYRTVIRAVTTGALTTSYVNDT